MKTVEAVKGRWPEIFEYYNLPPVTYKTHFKGDCPVCGRKGKFRIDNKDDRGTYICTCGSGDGWRLLELTQGKDFKTLAREIDNLIGNTFHQIEPTKTPDIENYRTRVISKFATLPPLRETSASSYLINRGIFSLPTNHVRFNDSEILTDGTYQSIWSIATDDRGAGCYLHRTILQNGSKAEINNNKLLKKLHSDEYLNFAGSVAIRMFPVSSTLGIETALSCKQVYGSNTWSTLNSGFMKKFRAPSGVTHLIIFADCDKNGAGLAAAFECGNKNILSKNDVEKVSIRWPEYGDFNDMLLDGSKVYQQVLTRF